MYDTKIRNRKIEQIKEATDAAKRQFLGIWLIVRVAGTFIVALAFGAILSSPTAKTVYPSIEGLKLELASPKIWTLQFVFAITLALIVLTSPLFKRFVNYVYLALVASCYGSAVLFGIGLGDTLGRGIGITSTNELNEFILIFILKLFVASLLLLFLYIASQIISKESVEKGFLHIWWRTSRITRFGAPLYMFLIALLQWIYKGGII